MSALFYTKLDVRRSIQQNGQIKHLENFILLLNTKLD